MTPNEILATFIVLTLIAALLFWWLRSHRTAMDVRGLFDVLHDDSASAAVLNLTLGPPRRIKLAEVPPFPTGPTYRRGLPLTIQPSTKSLWQEKGWQSVNGQNEYRGNFSAGGRTYRGLISQPYDGRFEAYIWNPPLPELSRNTVHAPCFTNGRSNGEYKIHFRLQPVSLDHTITSVEVVLEEALTGKRF